ncbi:MAG: CotS family spore coat protein [Lachnospiraceae bacterium]|nr:CotS family spore coat protein [Lachnospiraceae bacterium]
MNDRSAQILEQYDLSNARIRKGRGAILAETEEGTFRLQECHSGVGRLLYEEELMNYIRDKGNILVNSIVRNRENALFSADQAGNKYVLTRHYEGNECDVRNKNDIYEAVKVLARLHNITAHVELKNVEYVPVLTSSREEIAKHNAELKRIRLFIRDKTRKSEFEYDVLAHFDEFFEQAKQAEQDLKNSCYDKLNEEAVQNYSVCHGNYNYHNIIHVDGELAVINFEHSGRGLLIRDLYFFMRKVMEKHDWNKVFGVNLLESYDKIRTISKEERKILQILFTYPEKYWKILNHYYNGNKAYLPDQMKDKMKKVYQQQKNKNSFLYF